MNVMESQDAGHPEESASSSVGSTRAAISLHMTVPFDHVMLEIHSVDLMINSCLDF